MFNTLRQNSLIYVLFKGDKPALKMGQVMTTPVIRPKYATPIYGLPLENVVDLVVKIDDKVLNYNNLPSQADITDSFSNGDSIVISDNKTAMNSEINSYKQKSMDIIKSVDMHKAIISQCEVMLKDLNPEYAEKQQLQEEIINLKKLISDISSSMSLLMESNKLLMAKLSKEKN